ncbi:MAG: hypothetical protein GX678_02630 [Actinomycetales bacterium]|nr:hypothetical protein [Actinomycetales bacterium]
MGDFAKPLVIGPDFFDAIDSGVDPAEIAAAGNRVAQLLVRGPRVSEDEMLVERVLTLADREGLCSIAELWSTALPDSLAGALWRLYLLRAWVHNEPSRAAREFTAGRTWTPVDEVLAGVQDPPGPREVCILADDVIRGVLRSDVDVAFDRAAAFAHIVAVGRAHLAHEDHDNSGDSRQDALSAVKLMDAAKHLRHAARLERAGKLS